MKKFVAIVMLVVVMLGCVCTANADKYVSDMTDEARKDLYVQVLIGALVCEIEKDEEVIDYYEVEYDPETDIVRVYAEYAPKEGENYFDIIELRFKYDNAIVEDIMNGYGLNLDEDDCVSIVECRCAVDYAMR